VVSARPTRTSKYRTGSPGRSTAVGSGGGSALPDGLEQHDGRRH